MEKINKAAQQGDVRPNIEPLTSLFIFFSQLSSPVMGEFLVEVYLENRDRGEPHRLKVSNYIEIALPEAKPRAILSLRCQRSCPHATSPPSAWPKRRHACHSNRTSTPGLFSKYLATTMLVREKRIELA